MGRIKSPLPLVEDRPGEPVDGSEGGRRPHITATATLPTVEPNLEEDTGTGSDSGWVVTVYDNDFNTWDEVVTVLIRATGCTVDEAHMETWEVHHLGKSVVHHGSHEECKAAADVISTIGIRVTVAKE